MILKHIASTLLIVGALALPAFSSAHACDGDRAEHKAPSAESAQKSDLTPKQDKPTEQNKSVPKQDKASQSQTGKTS
jgi:hypothetical protein